MKYSLVLYCWSDKKHLKTSCWVSVNWSFPRQINTNEQNNTVSVDVKHVLFFYILYLSPSSLYPTSQSNNVHKNKILSLTMKTQNQCRMPVVTVKSINYIQRSFPKNTKKSTAGYKIIMICDGESPPSVHQSSFSFLFLNQYRKQHMTVSCSVSQRQEVRELLWRNSQILGHNVLGA